MANIDLHKPLSNEFVVPTNAQIGATESLAPRANENEVACMGTLTNNLHLMMDSFYKPTPDRYKILCEAKAFPSDQYAFASQAKAHGFDPEDAIIEVSPRDGEYTLREEDILATIEEHGSSIALVIFSGIQYYTGQWFPMQSITTKAKEKIFKEIGMLPVIRERSLLLTGHLEKLLRESKYFVPPSEAARQTPLNPCFTIITPTDPESRGAQLSLLFLPVGAGNMVKIFDYLAKHGVTGDEREPDVIRLAPAPLYNTVDDCEAAAKYLNEAFDVLTS
ncbi:hypothetical protein H1R20_g362, partial [Candolleomyces eurysporus]